MRITKNYCMRTISMQHYNNISSSSPVGPSASSSYYYDNYVINRELVLNQN